MEKPKLLKIYKPVGMTPLELIESIRKDKPELAEQKMAFAGRLDPMAEGEMLILIGEECKNRKKYERLDKKYEFEVLFGVSTDTYDVLGKTISIALRHPEFDSGSIQKNIPSFIGNQLQEYPPYSSPRIKGKSLWWWAKEGKLSEIEIPKKEIEIYDLQCLSIAKKPLKKIHDVIVEKIAKVKGNFRQQEILDIWGKLYTQNMTVNLSIAKFSVHCSSGTYVRSITKELGEKLKIPTCTYSIKRTKIFYE